MDNTANIISIDFTKLRFEPLMEYHALNEYVESRFKEGVNNYLMIDEVQLCPKFELTINSLHSDEKYDINKEDWQVHIHILMNPTRPNTLEMFMIL